jgi:hypothetical protein
LSSIASVEEFDEFFGLMIKINVEGTKFGSPFDVMVPLLGKYAAKVFFGCFDQTTTLLFRSFLSEVVWSKHPKNTFAACFPSLRSATLEPPTNFIENIQ